MQISELVNWLEQQRLKFGDVEVVIDGASIEDVLVTAPRNGNNYAFLSSEPAA